MGESSPMVARDPPSGQLVDPGLRRATSEDVHHLKAVLAEEG
jgi:hypothetical protein